jgi:outer membrane protein OmpA-like peptidoglycan-associated protein
MKNLKGIFCLFLTLVSLGSLKAQDADNLWAISIGTNLVDFSESAVSKDLGGLLSDYANYGDLNSVPAISRISVSRYLDKGFALELAGSLNNITKDMKGSISDVSFFSVNLAARYDLNHLFGETGWFDPHVQLGVGNTWVDEESSFTVAPAFGFNLWFNDHVGLNLNSSYQSIRFGNFLGDCLGSYFQHSIGLVTQFDVRKDADGDGVYDKQDACPNTPGLVAFNGCPDTDADGIVDADDVCPNKAGLPEFNGCPDTDADGIVDGKDACPSTAGPKENKGCPWPDTDKDGILDKDDACPNQSGPKLNNGCPWPDTDADGIIDRDDPCPKESGPASNNGCPVVLPEELQTPASFQLGQSSLTPATKAYLNKVALFMSEFTDVRLAVQGHTCTIGSESENEKLAVSRAAAVKDYLVSKGMDAGRFDLEGFGFAKPVATNDTAAGRAKNRRVELKVKN